MISIFGIFNDASVKDDIMALTSKIETLLINCKKQTNIKLYFPSLQTKRKVIRNPGNLVTHVYFKICSHFCIHPPSKEEALECFGLTFDKSNI